MPGPPTSSAPAWCRCCKTTACSMRCVSSRTRCSAPGRAACAATVAGSSASMRSFPSWPTGGTSWRPACRADSSKSWRAVPGGLPSPACWCWTCLWPVGPAGRTRWAARVAGGQQQILAVGAGVIAEPRLLVLDEPSAGLAPMVITRILDAVAALSRQGMAILLVEQMVEAALRLADHGYLIETGKIVGEGSAETIRHSDALRSVYLGRHATD